MISNHTQEQQKISTKKLIKIKTHQHLRRSVTRMIIMLKTRCLAIAQRLETCKRSGHKASTTQPVLRR